MNNRRWKMANGGWQARSVLECGGKRSATPLWLGAARLGDAPSLSGSSQRPRSQSAVAACALSAHSKTWRSVVTFCVLLSSLCFQVRGQYSIDWHTIDGGGGTSTGGVYAVTGTIGQPDAGTMSGGNFSLQGGFWALPIAVLSTNALTLSIVAAAPGYATVSWSPPAPGFVLQERASLSAGSWANASSGTNNPATVPATLPTKFYRLHQE